MLRLFFLFVCVSTCVASAYVHVWPNVNVCMVCLWRYLWPICAFVPSSNPITFLRRSMRLINVLCRGFSFTQGTPNGLFTYMSYWQQIPLPIGNLCVNRQFEALGCMIPLGSYVEFAFAMSSFCYTAHTQDMGILPTQWFERYVSHRGLCSGQ